MSEQDEVLKQTGPLPVPQKVVESASLVQTQILVMLNEQNINKEKTNRTIFRKLDEAAELARTAVSTAECAHAETMGIKSQIETKFTELNGSVQTAIKRLGKLEEKDGERDVEALKEAVAANAVTVATKGVIMIPKPDAITVATALGSIAAVVSLIASGQLKEFVIWIAGKL